MIAAAVLFALGVYGVERFWRQQGHRPSIVDDKALWAYHRGRVYSAGRKTVVLLGASRIQLGFSTETFRRRFPAFEIVQLAVNGTSPAATLRDLASDRRFNGIVIYSANPLWLRCDKPLGVRKEQDEYIDYYYREYSLNERANRVVGAWFQGQLVTVNPTVRVKRVLDRAWIGKPLPKPFYLATHFDRSRSADYSMLDVADHRQKRIEKTKKLFKKTRPQSREGWLDGLNEVEEYVDAIQRRGGKVVFVSFPMTGEGLALYEEHYPRRLHWDVFAARTKGVAVNCLDIPEVADIECPDTSHIDQRDKTRFTDALLDELVRRSVF